MKEIKKLYKAIARVHGSISRAKFGHVEIDGGDIDAEDGKPDNDRCRSKEDDCRDEYPYINYNVMDACITNAILEAFENAHYNSTPLEVLCAAAKAACGCEVDFKIKKCERNKAYADCVEGAGDGSPEERPCPRPPDSPSANEDCGSVDDKYSRGQDWGCPNGDEGCGWCGYLCAYCNHTEFYDCGISPTDEGVHEIIRRPTLTGDNFWTCEFIAAIIRELKNSQGIFKIPCSIGSQGDQCDACDCMKDHSDKLKVIANGLRKIIKSLGCRGLDIPYTEWYENYDYDGCRSENDCETGAEETPYEILIPDIPRPVDLSPDDR